MPATIIDVARKAGVSKTTVSAVLCGKSGVSAETRLAVLEAIKALDYVPNINARNFVRKRTSVLGALIISDSREEENGRYDFGSETGVYSQDVINGIIGSIADYGYGLVTQYAPTDLSGDESVPPMLSENRVDGVFLIGAAKPSARVAELLAERECPVVAIGRTYDNIDSLRVNTVSATYLAARKLFETGHRDVYLLNCPMRYSSSAERKEGFFAAARDAGLTYDDKYIVYSNENTGDAGYRALNDLLRSTLPRPDGIIAANNSITMGAMRCLYDRKLRVPDDVSIVGHEDSIMYGYAAPALTAVNIRKEYTGREAVKIMLRRLKKDNGDFPLRISVEPILTERMSVKSKINYKTKL